MLGLREIQARIANANEIDVTVLCDIASRVCQVLFDDLVDRFTFFTIQQNFLYFGDAGLLDFLIDEVINRVGRAHLVFFNCDDYKFIFCSHGAESKVKNSLGLVRAIKADTISQTTVRLLSACFAVLDNQDWVFVLLV